MNGLSLSGNHHDIMTYLYSLLQTKPNKRLVAMTTVETEVMNWPLSKCFSLIGIEPAISNIHEPKI